MKTFMSEEAKHIIHLPHSNNHTLSQTTQKFLSSSQAQQPQSLQSISGVIQWR